MISKLTIVLTIKGRVDFTLRWMAYMNSVQCKFKIFIADGGDDVDLQMHLKNKNNYLNLNYDYFKYPFDACMADYYKKICDVTDKVVSPYILYADNDDFFILDDIEEYIHFLDNNTDYVCCGGTDAALSIHSKSNEVLNTSAGDFINIRFDKSELFSIQSESRVERICDFFKYTESNKLWFIWYDIQRTSVVKLTHEYIRQHEFKDVVTMEIYKILSLLLFGKSKRFDSIFYIRQIGSSQTSSALDKEANVIERFIKINAFEEILDGLIYLDKSITNSHEAILRSFSFWLAQKGVILYFSRESKILLLNKIPFVSRNFQLINFLVRGLYLLRNLISSRKVYFLRLKSIEPFIIFKNQSDTKI